MEGAFRTFTLSGMVFPFGSSSRLAIQMLSASRLTRSRGIWHIGLEEGQLSSW